MRKITSILTSSPSQTLPEGEGLKKTPKTLEEKGETHSEFIRLSIQRNSYVPFKGFLGFFLRSTLKSSKFNQDELKGHLIINNLLPKSPPSGDIGGFKFSL